MTPFSADRRGFFSLIGILLALALACAMYFFILKMYVQKPVVDRATAGSIKESGIDTSGYSAILNSTKSRLRDIEKQQDSQYKDLGQ